MKKTRPWTPSGAIVRVRWLRAANRNFDAAATYVAKEDSDAAQKMYAHIRGHVAELAKRPEMGRPGRLAFFALCVI